MTSRSCVKHPAGDQHRVDDQVDQQVYVELMDVLCLDPLGGLLTPHRHGVRRSASLDLFVEVSHRRSSPCRRFPGYSFCIGRHGSPEVEIGVCSLNWRRSSPGFRTEQPHLVRSRKEWLHTAVTQGSFPITSPLHFAERAWTTSLLCHTQLCCRPAQPGPTGNEHTDQECPTSYRANSWSHGCIPNSGLPQPVGASVFGGAVGVALSSGGASAIPSGLPTR